MVSDQDARREKYDRAAAAYAERFADPEAIVSSYLRLLSEWGTPVRAGDAVLELGCADGFVTVALARAGYRVTAVDLSPQMIDVARHRLDAAGLHAEFVVADIQDLPSVAPGSAVIGLMRSFFSYVDDPSSILRVLARSARKVLVDADPRRVNVRDAASLVRAAGFERVSHRAMFVPTRYSVPPPLRAMLRMAEVTPGVRDLILRRKFLVAIKGERA